jgi:hypothetical protein
MIHEMTMEQLDGHDLPGALLDVTRQALAESAEDVDASAVQLDTPLGALIFDSLMATTFIAHLEGLLGVQDLPFEGWLLSHSERSDALTVGSLVTWLQELPEVRRAGVGREAARR